MTINTQIFYDLNQEIVKMYKEEREMHKVTCAECGKDTEVPFEPDGKRPVYCRDCYRKRKPRRF